MSELYQIEKKYTDFFESIEEYSRQRLNDDRVSNVISLGLGVYTKYEDVRFSALYLIDEETFEFNYSSSIPTIKPETAGKIFQALVDNDTVGTCLRNASVAYFPNDNKEIYKNYYLIVPLIASNGILGIVLLSLSKPPCNMEQMFFRMIGIMSNLFAATIESTFKEIKLKKAEQLLDQKVAFRTISLVESRKQLEDQFESLRTDLSSSMPHEVRTPIFNILGYSDLLMKKFKKSGEDEDTVSMLQNVRLSAERLKRLFENYLYYSHLTILSTNYSEIMKVRTQKVISAESVIHESAWDMASNRNRLEDLQLNLADAPIAISETYLRKLLEEILDNCFKFSDKGTPVEITTRVNNEMYEMTFRDSGRGMTEDQIRNINAYMQFDRGTHEQQGSGLGMTIARKIVDIHEGQFELESTIDEYTIFRIALPIALG